MTCSCWKFTLAEIVDVSKLTIKIIPWIQQNPNLDFPWIEMPSLECIILKSLVIAKQIHLTQKNILKKNGKLF
jgi:hypothetical protein